MVSPRCYFFFPGKIQFNKCIQYLSHTEPSSDQNNFTRVVGHCPDFPNVFNFLDLNVRGIWLISLYLMNHETNMFIR